MAKQSRYVMGSDGNPTKFIDFDTYYFGEKHDVRVPAAKTKKDQQLSLSVASDGETLWLQGRRDELLQMSREEALEMMDLLHKLYPLDSLGRA